MEKGVIKWFDGRDNKRFGFIVVEGGEEIFFHYNDGERFAAGDGDEPCLAGGKPREPRKGDRVVFERFLGHKGFKASLWGYADDYKKAAREIAARPAPIIYRVMKQYQFYGDKPQPEPEVLWQGNNIDQLCQKYPRPSDIRLDDLYPFFSCGDFATSVWFERQTADGKWQRCGDPRPLKARQHRRW